jgi:hypothetical protein
MTRQPREENATAPSANSAPTILKQAATSATRPSTSTKISISPTMLRTSHRLCHLFQSPGNVGVGNLAACRLKHSVRTPFDTLGEIPATIPPLYRRFIINTLTVLRQIFYGEACYMALCHHGSLVYNHFQACNMGVYCEELSGSRCL